MTGYAYTVNGKILQLKDVSLTFGDAPVLRNITADIVNYVRPDMQQGQVVALLGPSGVGKTMLSRLIAGLEIPGGSVSGEILIGDVQAVPVRQGLVGMVAQHYPLFMHRTVLDNLVVAARQAGRNRKDALDAANQMLRTFAMTDRGEVYPAQLSGGQRQRAAIAQQLLCSEHVVLMDEPFSGLDPNMVDVVTDLILHVSQQDEYNTLIVITHDISAALAIADTVWIMGRDRNPDGSLIPGAYLKHRYDLIAEGLAWHPGIRELPRFRELHNEIRRLFPAL